MTDSWHWYMFRSRLHRLGVHWYRVNGPIPGRMCFFCGAWMSKGSAKPADTTEGG